MMELEVGGRQAFLHTGGLEFDPSHPVVVLLHGAGMDHVAWRDQTRALAHEGVAAVAPDLPGHGRSEGPVRPSIEEMAGWVVDLLEVLGVERATLAGHSMGSLVAVEVAAAHRERVERLILAGASGEMGVHPDLLAAAEDDLPLAARLIAGWSFGGHGRMGGHPRSGTWLRAGAIRLVEASPPGTLTAGLRACVAYPGLQRAAEVIAPALVIAGDVDRMTPLSAGIKLADALPEGRLEVVEGAGHMLMAEHPGEVLALMRDFLGV